MSINWKDGKSLVSKYFSVHECIFLPSWARMATEEDGLNDEIKDNLIKLCSAMDLVREYFDKPINVHVTYRPEDYNNQVHGAQHSQHKIGLAMDFDVKDLTCKDAIASILADNKLEEWSMRMENNGSDPTWIHLDLKEVIEGHSRYFIP